MTEQEHDSIALRLVEAITGEIPLDAELSAHAFACPSCGRLARGLRALAQETREAADAHSFAGFDQRLRARLAGETTNVRPGRRWLRVALPMAAALGAVGLALWLLRPEPAGPGPQPEGPVASADSPEIGSAPETAPPDGATGLVAPLSAAPEAVVAAAELDSLEAEFGELGLAASWDDDVATWSSAAPVAASAQGPARSGPAPAWGDVLGGLEEDLAGLDPRAQADLALALRSAG